MYTLVWVNTTAWRNHLVYALVNDSNAPIVQIEMQYLFWSDEPICVSVPYASFEVSRHAPKPDVLSTGTLIDLYSPRLLELLRSAGVQFESFPAMLIDRKTREPLPLEYEMFHLLDHQDALDMEKSDIESTTDYPLGVIRKLVVRQEFLHSPRPMFRLRKLFDLVLMHEDLRKMLEEHKISGFYHEPLEEYQSYPPGYEPSSPKLREAEARLTQTLATLPHIGQFEILKENQEVWSHTAYGETCWYARQSSIYGTQQEFIPLLDAYTEQLQAQGWILLDDEFRRSTFDEIREFHRGLHDRLVMSSSVVEFDPAKKQLWESQYDEIFTIKVTYILPQEQGC